MVSNSINNKEEEFVQLIEQNQQILHKICFVYACNSYNKDDLYQEIVLQSWKSYSSFQAKSSFSTWLYKVALNTAISRTRKKSYIFEDHSEIESNYESDFIKNEEIRILYMAISKLSKIDKALILLWLEEKTYEEIADTIGISVKNVSVKLVRIKAKLEQIIKKLS